MKKRIIKVGLIFGFLICLLLGYFFLNKYTGFSIPCLIHHTTGVYCSGCGITRMLFSLLRLDIVAAFNYNQFLFILLPIFLVFLFHDVFIYIIGKKNYWFKKVPVWIYIVLLVLVFVWMICRNLPWFPFLRP